MKEVGRLKYGMIIGQLSRYVIIVFYLITALILFMWKVDGGRSAQYEHEVLITRNGVEILTIN